MKGLTERYHDFQELKAPKIDLSVSGIILVIDIAEIVTAAI